MGLTLQMHPLLDSNLFHTVSVWVKVILDLLEVAVLC